MKILSALQTRALDAYTIKNEPVSSLDLMERASMAFTNWFTQQIDYKNTSIHIFCGPGNNGGDGLAIARLLHHSFYTVQVYICKIGNQTSVDFDQNLKQLPGHDAIQVIHIKNGDDFPNLQKNAVIIDGLFGSGLNRPVEGYWAKLIHHLNQQPITRIAIDIPSGLFADKHSEGMAIRAHQTFSFEFPKLAFLFPENYQFVGQWDTASIGLLKEGLNQFDAVNYFIDLNLARSIYRRRSKYAHKGTFGHALLFAGSYGMTGAAILSTKAALRSGAGLVTLHTPQIAYAIIQGNIPEAIVSIDPEEHFISTIPELSKYSAIGIGPGINTKKLTVNALNILFESHTSPVILDADALNIIAKDSNLLEKIPKGSILTPHPKEFERLFGKSSNDFARNTLQRTKAQELSVYILLKGAHSCIACPDGNCYFNSTGNPGMATAGSGDVLTGIITGLLAQGYTPQDAAVLGVYLHGLAGDLGMETIGSEEALIAGDLVMHIGKAFEKISYK